MAVGTDVATVAAIHNVVAIVYHVAVAIVVAVAGAVAFVVVHRRMQWEPTTIESSSSDVRGPIVSPRETVFPKFLSFLVV